MVKNSSKNNSEFRTLIIIAFSIVMICIVCFFAYYLYSYNDFLFKSLEVSSEERIKEITTQQSYNLELVFEEKKSMVESIAKSFSSYVEERDIEIEDIVAPLQSYAETSGFTYFCFANDKGEAVTNEGQLITISNKEYFTRALKGEIVINSKTDTIINREEKLLPFSAPIYINDRIQAVLIAYLKVDDMNEIIASSFEGTGYSAIVNDNGDIVFQAINDYTYYVSDNIFSEYLDYMFLESSLDEVKNNIDISLSGTAEYIGKDAETSRIVIYIPTKINDWWFFTVFPSSTVRNQVESIMQTTAIFILLITATLFSFLLFILNKLKKNRSELYGGVYFDVLTGFPNMRKFKMDFEKSLKSNHNERFVCIYFDINQFKIINELYGKEKGDMLLKVFDEGVKLIRDKHSSDSFYIARDIADKFFIYDLFTSYRDVDTKLKHFVNFVEKKIDFLDNYKVELRLGHYISTANVDNVSTIIEKTILAHQVAKKLNTTKFIDYKDEFKEDLIRKAEFSSKAEKALKDQKFNLILQARHDMKTGKICGAEALSRWKTDDMGVLKPGEYIDILEETGLIVEHDYYILEKVCECIYNWGVAGKQIIPISVNFSRRHFLDANFIPKLVEVANRYDIPKHMIEIEVTEAIAGENRERLIEVLHTIHDIGFRLGMDRFGTGYSSLTMLKDLELDVIKLHKIFFQDIEQHGKGYKVAKAVVEMAKRLGIETVAEGVEKETQITALLEIGCEVAQGYFYSLPVDINEFHA